jgi:hypothetical protein
MVFIEVYPGEVVNTRHVISFKEIDGMLRIRMTDFEEVESILSFDQFKQLVQADDVETKRHIAQLARYQMIPTP